MMLSYARAHYGRCYHAVEVRNGQVYRALCGADPQQWGYRHSGTPRQGELHRVCRQRLQRPDNERAIYLERAPHR